VAQRGVLVGIRVGSRNYLTGEEQYCYTGRAIGWCVMKALILLLYWPLVGVLIALLSGWLFHRGIGRRWIYLVQVLCLTVVMFGLRLVVVHRHLQGFAVRADFLNPVGWREDLLSVFLWMVTYGLFFYLQGKLAPGLYPTKAAKIPPEDAEEKAPPVDEE